MKCLQTDNAQQWAKDFIETIQTNPDIVVDEEFMTGWFANAIEVSSDIRYYKTDEYKNMVKKYTGVK